jgi:hypothetical protein
VLLTTVRIRDLVIRVVLCNQIQENSTTLKDLDLVPILVFISESGNATVRVNLQEPGFLLFVLGKVQSYNLDDALVY